MDQPQFRELFSLSLERMLHFIKPMESALPMKIFPLPETLRCTQADWKRFGDLDAEQHRLMRILSTNQQRNVPSSCERILQSLLDQEDVLAGWKQVVPEIVKMGGTEIGRIARIFRTESSRTMNKKSDFVAIPVDYEFDSLSTTALRLWDRSLEEVSIRIKESRKKDFICFLQIHSFLKDPISGLLKDFETQHTLFVQLLDAFEEKQSMKHLRSDRIHRVAAQAAQESSFLSVPLLQHLICVSRQDNIQLPYVRIQLSELCRAEFSVPEHVLEVVEEMLTMARAHEGHTCLLVPILIASRPGFLEKSKHLTCIIDGNHRATAAVFLRFLANHRLSEDHKLMSAYLMHHCESQGLGRKWQVDLLDVLDRLYDASALYFYNFLVAHRELVQMFAHVTHIPALVVQEEDFLTICKQRSAGQPTPVLLQPFHQTIFNDDDLQLALPQKAGQTHGRPDVFTLMPLEPFGSDGCNLDTVYDIDANSSQLLRKSWVGLPSKQSNP